MGANSIEMDGVSFSVDFIHTFESEKAFVDHWIDKQYQQYPVKHRRELLKFVYNQAKKTLPKDV